MPSFSFTLTTTGAPASSTPPSPAAIAGETAGRDLKLSASTGDLELVEGDLVLVAGAEGVASDLRSRLQTFAGEWFLDTSIGLPYFAEFEAKASLLRLEEMFRGAILETPGVARLESLTLSKSGRTLSVRFRAITDLGALIDATLTQEV